MTRALPSLVIAALAALATGCAIPDQHTPVAIGTTPPTTPPPTTQPSTPTARRVTVFLVQGSHLAIVERRTTPGLKAAITDLLAGPTTQEKALGLTSAIPSGTKLNSATQVGATAQLDFTDALGTVSGREEVLAFAQIVATSTSLPGVQQVQVAIAGQTVNAPLQDGTLAQGPVTRADYASLLPS